MNTYVELEKYRSGHSFKYIASIGEGVSLHTTIPRMLIHTFVENSIKHGIRLGEKDALIEVKITRNSKYHQILIRDNGPGHHSNNNKLEPGIDKGLQIIDEMIGLFNQLEGILIKYSIEDLSLRDTNRLGTEAIITIPG